MFTQYLMEIQGSNMSMTLNSMINDLEEKTDDKIKMPELIEVVEEAVLMGARGKLWYNFITSNNRIFKRYRR